MWLLFAHTLMKKIIVKFTESKFFLNNPLITNDIFLEGQGPQHKKYPWNVPKSDISPGHKAVWRTCKKVETLLFHMYPMWRTHPQEPVPLTASSTVQGEEVCESGNMRRHQPSKEFDIHYEWYEHKYLSMKMSRTVAFQPTMCIFWKKQIRKLIILGFSSITHKEYTAP